MCRTLSDKTYGFWKKLPIVTFQEVGWLEIFWVNLVLLLGRSFLKDPHRHFGKNVSKNVRNEKAVSFHKHGLNSLRAGAR